MFESPVARALFRIDPWPPAYGVSLQTESDEDSTFQPLVQTDVEPVSWDEGITPPRVERLRSIVFIDGVQRIDAWGFIDDGERAVEAALASVAVGAVDCTPEGASVVAWRVERLLALTGARDELSMHVVAGARTLEFRPVFSSRNDLSGRAAVNDAVSRRRHEMERRLGEEWMQDERLVVVDGRLSAPSSESAVVGLTKTIHQLYLEDPERRLLPRLGPGQRTPVFRIEYDSRTTRYSWFLRLADARPINHVLAGIVRIETPDIGAGAAIRLADLTSACLPAFASRPEHDPRAPQNLLPVGALEKRLRHEMGDQLFIRRAIEDHLMQEVMA